MMSFSRVIRGVDLQTWWLLALLLAGFGLLMLFTGEPRYQKQTRAFLGEMKAQTTAEALRKWAAEVCRTHAGASQATELPPSQIPVEVGRTSAGLPVSVMYVPELNGRPAHVLLMWGGGFGHWGLAVGPESFVMGGPDRFVVDWEAGVFAWSDSR